MSEVKHEFDELMFTPGKKFREAFMESSAGESILAHSRQFQLRIANQAPERAAAIRSIFCQWAKDNGIAVTGGVDIVSHDPKAFLAAAREDQGR